MSIFDSRMSASDVKTLRVYLGAHNIKNGARTEHRVVRIIKHIDFEPRTLVCRNLELASHQTITCYIMVCAMCSH